MHNIGLFSSRYTERPLNRQPVKSRRKLVIPNSIHDVYHSCLESDNHVVGDEISVTYLLESLLLCSQGTAPGSTTMPGEFT